MEEELTCLFFVSVSPGSRGISRWAYYETNLRNNVAKASPYSVSLELRNASQISLLTNPFVLRSFLLVRSFP
jgi:hypothetical protein